MKSKLLTGGPEKMFVLVFDAGEEVMSGLLRFATEQQLASAHLTAIGAFERVTLGFFDIERKDYEKIPVNEQVEVLSLIGNLARDERGDVKAHAHVVIGKRDGTAHGGHLLEAYVCPTLEVVMVQSAAPLRRSMRPEFGVALLD